jgi:pimeloyl-ACP methyl ester carboxylesterase
VNLGDGLAGLVFHGDGDTVLWLHGYTLDSTCWLPLWEQLPGLRHVGLDLPGHGNSLPLRTGETLPVVAHRVAAVATSIGARHLVAASFGAVVALQVAVEAEDAITTLALAGPVLGGGPFERDVWERYDAVKAEYARHGHRAELADLWSCGGASLFCGVDRSSELSRQIRRQLLRHGWWDVENDAYRALWETPQFLKELARIDLPTLVLVGANDRPAVRQTADFLERLLPNCRRQDVADAGHLCLQEEPADAAATLAAHWDAELPTGAVEEVANARAD